MAQLFPNWPTACALATEMPDLVADFLNLDSGLHRRFREESISDLIVAALLNLKSRDVFALVPNEAKTGSDFDIIVLNENTYEAIQFRIQAKRLTVHNDDWEVSSYRKLAHPHNTGEQAATLIRSSAHEAITTIPLYAFYNPRNVCEASGGIVSGVELADGRAISTLVRALVNAKPKRLPLKRIKYLKRLFFPFATILCPTSDSDPGMGVISSPGALQEAAELLIYDRKQSFDGREVEEELGLDKMALGSLSAPSYPEEFIAEYGRISPPRELVQSAADGAEPESETTRPLRTREIRRFPKVIENALKKRGDQIAIKANVKRPRVIFVASEE